MIVLKRRDHHWRVTPGAKFCSGFSGGGAAACGAGCAAGAETVAAETVVADTVAGVAGAGVGAGVGAGIGAAGAGAVGAGLTDAAILEGGMTVGEAGGAFEGAAGLGYAGGAAGGYDAFPGLNAVLGGSTSGDILPAYTAGLDYAPYSSLPDVVPSTVGAAGAGGVTSPAGLPPTAPPASAGSTGGLFSKDNIMLANSGLQMYRQDQMRKMAKAADPMGDARKGYGKQLKALEANPNSITSTPGYQFGLDQGSQALQRSMAAQGYSGSGNAQIAMNTYAQNYAMKFLNQEEQRLAMLAGANIGPGYAIEAMNASNDLMGGAANNLAMWATMREQPGKDPRQSGR